MSKLWVVVACLVVAVVRAYPSGPPISTDPGICLSMFPTGHNAPEQTTPSPFVITVDTSNCYTDGMDIIVSVKTKTGLKNELAGLLMEARTPSTANQAYGTWSALSTNSAYFRANTCFGKTANAISQKQELDDSKCESLVWKAPANFTSPIRFTATLVEEKKVFWINVVSNPIHYATNCTATGAKCAPSPPESSAGKPAVHLTVMFAILLSFITSLH